MIAYLAAFRARARTVFRYRAAALAGIFTQIFFGFILVMVLESWFMSSPSAARIGFSQAASYVWLGQAFLALQVWGPDPELRDLIRSGEIARDLLRPTSLYGLWFVRTLAWKCVALVMRLGAVLAFAGFGLPLLGMADIGLRLPASWPAFFAFLALLLPAILSSAALAAGVSCFQFKQISAAGASALAAALSSFFSGLIIPLPLLSGPVEAISRYLPYRGLADLPFRFWLGETPVRALPAAIAGQTAWVILLFAAGAAYVRSRAGRDAVAGG